jgi:hypothetical protein
MLVRIITFLCITVVSVAQAGTAPERMFFGTWCDDISDPTTRISFRPDHSFIIQGGEPLVTFIEGTWRVQDGRTFISRVKAAGKPLVQPECGQHILSASSVSFVLEASHPHDKPVTYTRVR